MPTMTTTRKLYDLIFLLIMLTTMMDGVDDIVVESNFVAADDDDDTAAADTATVAVAVVDNFDRNNSYSPFIRFGSLFYFWFATGRHKIL